MNSDDKSCQVTSYTKYNHATLLNKDATGHETPRQPPLDLITLSMQVLERN